MHLSFTRMLQHLTLDIVACHAHPCKQTNPSRRSTISANKESIFEVEQVAAFEHSVGSSDSDLRARDAIVSPQTCSKEGPCQRYDSFASQVGVKLRDLLSLQRPGMLLLQRLLLGVSGQITILIASDILYPDFKEYWSWCWTCLKHAAV